MSFTAGYETVLAYAVETAPTASSYGFTSSLPTPPASPIVIGYANVPGVKTERGNKKGYGIGSPFALYNGKGTRRYEVTIDAPLTGPAPLKHFLRNSGGYKGIADLCLFVGKVEVPVSSSFEERQRLIRMAKCNSFTLALAEGSAQEVRLQATLMGLYEQIVSGVITFPEAPEEPEDPEEEPEDSQTLITPGAPYFWNTVITANVVNGDSTIQMRDFLSSVNITGTHNLKPRGFRPGTSDSNPLHLSHYSIIPGKFVGRATLGLHEPLKHQLRAADINSSIWGDVVVSMAYDGLGAGDKELEITLHDCILDPDSQNAGDDGDAPITYSCDILYSRITVSDGSETFG